MHTEIGPETQDLPAKLWKIINDHHAAKSAKLILLYEQALNSIQQGQNQSLPNHTENFNKAVNKFKSIGGKMEDADLGRKLMMSLNSTYFHDTREISLKGITSYDEVLTELRKRLQVDSMLREKYPNHTTVKITTEASAISRNKNRKCMRLRCLGTNHSPDQCFKKPGNEHLQQEWITERIKLGHWKGEVPKFSAEASALAANHQSSDTNQLDEPTIEELEVSFNQMYASASHISAIRLSTSKVAFCNQDGVIVALLDTAASHHMFKEQHVFDTYENISDASETLEMAGREATLPILGQGTVCFKGPEGHCFILENCLHVPSLK
ncbi:hypothetical protein CROQUDRAFT_129878 [Cronartium quercuum f. sp. fusiforme G11]|uniref:Retrovirus-related Pol polyprotein from transposon TNT 1-94-like beta-barrel domain-containing protein n=1 Tax=Cronartium quercuum f. sp. fusiforme G11 TaxID=708437 RepID=A0A9P6NWP2_9BASI|nr:hypothetical protein CROQUDRAFT_129878 [Cronartium quercuum f. sp. fusiforme G11]